MAYVKQPETDIDPELTAEVAAWARSLRAKNRSAKTIKGYLETADLLADFLVAHGRPTAPAEIRRADVEAFITDQLERWSPSTAATRYRCVQQLFKYLVDVEVLDRSPMATMSPPSIPDAPIPVFTDDELAAMLKVSAGTGFQNRRDHAILRLFTDTGIRLGEMAGIRLEDLDLDNEVVLVTGKGNRSRYMPLNPKLQVAFDWYLRERRKHKRASEPWLWIGPRGRLTSSGIANVVEERAKAAGVEDAHAHRYRHTFAHRWQAAGANEGDLQRLMGWRSPQMLARYGASAADERARDAYRRAALWEQL
jgi:site-specific recombinase XerD